MTSIANKVLMSLIVTITLVLGGVSSAAYFINISKENAQFEQTQSALATQMQVILRDPVFTYDFDLTKRIIDAYIPAADIAFITVTDHREKPIASMAKDKIEAAETQTLKLLDDEGKHIGIITMGFSKALMSKRLADGLIEKLITLIISLSLLCAILLLQIRKIVVQPLSKVSGILADIAKGGGDLTQSITIKSNDEIGLLSESFNSFIKRIREIVTEVAFGAQQLENLSTNVSDISNNASSNTQKQKEKSEHSLIYLQQLSEATAEIAQNAEITAATSQEASETATQSRLDVSQNLGNVNELVSELDNSAKIVTELRTESENIGGVLDVIKGIAEQTNLLALNAAIEAARAGESGRGFAVVADEVRALAQKTRESTDEIEQIILSLQNKSQESFDATHKSKSLVTHTIESTKKTSDSFIDISEKMNKINDMIIQVASASEEQSLLTKEMTETMQSLCTDAQTLALEAQEMTTSSNEMLEVEKTLTSNIHEFKY